MSIDATTSSAQSRATAEECLADLTPVQRNRVRQAFSGSDFDGLAAADVTDLCDRVSGRITFSEYLARGRARRRATGAGR